jgi:hypothetical protein
MYTSYRIATLVCWLAMQAAGPHTWQALRLADMRHNDSFACRNSRNIPSSAQHGLLLHSRITNTRWLGWTERHLLIDAYLILAHHVLNPCNSERFPVIVLDTASVALGTCGGHDGQHCVLSGISLCFWRHIAWRIVIEYPISRSINCLI